MSRIRNECSVLGCLLGLGFWDFGPWGIRAGAAGWSDQSLALPAGEVAGKTIKLEFRFVSNEDGSVWGGFYIDDVSVTLP